MHHKHNSGQFDEGLTHANSKDFRDWLCVDFVGFFENLLLLLLLLKKAIPEE